MQYSDEIREKCIAEYLRGVNKKELVNRYNIDMSTISAWIRKKEIPEIDLRIAKRAKTIPIGVQKEILKALNTNAILKGFNISIWNDSMLKDFMKGQYNILTNLRTTRNLIEDSRYFQEIDYEEKTFNDIDYMEKLGYNIILLDYLKIGKICRQEIPDDVLKEKGRQKDVLDVYLVIGRASSKPYIDVVYLERVEEVQSLENFSISGRVELSDDEKKEISRRSRHNLHCKRVVLNKIINSEDRNVVFVTTQSNDIEKILRIKKYKFYIVNEELYPELIQSTYEPDEGMIEKLKKSNDVFDSDGTKTIHIDDIDKMILKIEKLYNIFNGIY